MRRALTCGVALLLAAARAAAAQRPQPEARLDVVGPGPARIEPGVGLNVALGYYVRVGAAAGYNVRRAAAGTGGPWRGDLLARFTFDPFRQQRWGLSLGGGLSVRQRTRLAVVLDLEGPEIGGVLPAIQAGMSGGARVALVLRHARPNRR